MATSILYAASTHKVISIFKIFTKLNMGNFFILFAFIMVQNGTNQAGTIEIEKMSSFSTFNLIKITQFTLFAIPSQIIIKLRTL